EYHIRPAEGHRPSAGRRSAGAGAVRRLPLAPAAAWEPRLQLAGKLSGSHDDQAVVAGDGFPGRGWDRARAAARVTARAAGGAAPAVAPRPGGTLAVGMLGLAVHPFVLGIGAREIFSRVLHAAPPAGYCSLTPSNSPCSGPVQWAYHMYVPW